MMVMIIVLHLIYYIENKIRELVPSIKEIRHFDVGPVIGGHTGAGIIAVFFMGTER